MTSSSDLRTLTTHTPLPPPLQSRRNTSLEYWTCWKLEEFLLTDVVSSATQSTEKICYVGILCRTASNQKHVDTLSCRKPTHAQREPEHSTPTPLRPSSSINVYLFRFKHFLNAPCSVFVIALHDKPDYTDPSQGQTVHIFIPQPCPNHQTTSHHAREKKKAFQHSLSSGQRGRDPPAWLLAAMPCFFGSRFGCQERKY